MRFITKRCCSWFDNLSLLNYQQSIKEYPPEAVYKFDGFNDSSISVCFIRQGNITKDNKEMKVIFCCQLPSYTGTSITNRIENIAQNFAKDPSEIIVIEHYAAGLGLAPQASYAIVDFEDNFTSPSWNFVSLDQIKNLIQLSDDFFSFNKQDFLDWEIKYKDEIIDLGK